MNSVWLLRFGAVLLLIAFALFPFLLWLSQVGGAIGAVSAITAWASQQVPARALLWILPTALLFVLLLTIQGRDTTQLRPNLVGVWIALGIGLIGLLISFTRTVPLLMELEPAMSLNLVVLVIGGAILSLVGAKWLWDETGSTVSRLDSKDERLYHQALTSVTKLQPQIMQRRPFATGMPAQSLPARPSPIPETIRVQPKTQIPLQANGRPDLDVKSVLYRSQSVVKPMKAYLDVLKENRLPAGRIWIRQDDFFIGRGRENQLQLLDLSVSRRHARVYYAQNSWFIQDINSTHGTYINAKRIQAAPIRSGDQIIIGHTRMIFCNNDRFGIR